MYQQFATERIGRCSIVGPATQTVLYVVAALVSKH
jgi:hypothetical protein